MASDALDPTLQDAIQSFVVAATGLAGSKVIWLNQDTLRPAVPYVGLNISSGPRKTGHAEIKYKELDTFTYPFRKEITLSVNVYADSGWLNTIQDIINALELPTKQLILQNAGIAILDNTDPLDVSELLNDITEGRGAVDIFLGYATEVDDISGEIESVKIDQTVGDFESTQIIGGS